MNVNCDKIIQYKNDSLVETRTAQTEIFNISANTVEDQISVSIRDRVTNCVAEYMAQYRDSEHCKAFNNGFINYFGIALENAMHNITVHCGEKAGEKISIFANQILTQKIVEKGLESQIKVLVQTVSNQLLEIACPGVNQTPLAKKGILYAQQKTVAAARPAVSNIGRLAAKIGEKPAQLMGKVFGSAFGEALARSEYLPISGFAQKFSEKWRSEVNYSDFEFSSEEVVQQQSNSSSSYLDNVRNLADGAATMIYRGMAFAWNNKTNIAYNVSLGIAETSGAAAAAVFASQLDNLGNKIGYSNSEYKGILFYGLERRSVGLSGPKKRVYALKCYDCLKGAFNLSKSAFDASASICSNVSSGIKLLAEDSFRK